MGHGCDFLSDGAVDTDDAQHLCVLGAASTHHFFPGRFVCIVYKGIYDVFLHQLLDVDGLCFVLHLRCHFEHGSGIVCNGFPDSGPMHIR